TAACPNLAKYARQSRNACSQALHSSPQSKEKTLFEAQLCRLKAVLGKAALYLAASHTYRGDDAARIAALATLAERYTIPLVATGDILYHAPHRRPLQDVLTCIRLGLTIQQAGFRLEANAERHIKSPCEMTRLFKDHTEAIAHTLEIMDACR